MRDAIHESFDLSDVIEYRRREDNLDRVLSELDAAWESERTPVISDVTEQRSSAAR